MVGATSMLLLHRLFQETSNLFQRFIKFRVGLKCLQESNTLAYCNTKLYRIGPRSTKVSPGDCFEATGEPLNPQNEDNEFVDRLQDFPMGARICPKCDKNSKDINSKNLHGANL